MVTVIIPAYNRPNELSAALTSLRIQTDQDFKVIVSDDAGAVNLKEVCDDFPELEICYLRPAKNLGCGGNRRFALDYFFKHPTEHLMFLDSDDLLMPQAIARLNKAITVNEADIISTDIVQECDGPKQIIIKAEDSKTWLHGKIYKTQFLMDNHLQFNDRLETNEDLAFNLSLYAYDPESYFLHEQLYLWRSNDDSVTRSKNNTALLQRCNSIEYIRANYTAFKCYKAGMQLSPVLVANIIHIYNFWQRAVIYNTLTDEIRTQVHEMLHHPQIIKILFSFYQHGNSSLKLDAWCLKGESLIFFSQTYGQWLTKFFTPAEILQALRASKS